MATVLETFDKWKSFLKERVNAAQNKGMSEDTITNLATEIGDFLSNHVDPENKEQRLLKELWDVADATEQKTIARLMIKLVEKK
ncbi:MAG TPA: DUF3243 domain-containing protein [Bacilli bacterium]